jgi:hypothetical protein
MTLTGFVEISLSFQRRTKVGSELLRQLNLFQAMFLSLPPPLPSSLSAVAASAASLASFV